MTSLPWVDLALPAVVLAAAILIASQLRRIATVLAESRSPDPIGTFRDEMARLAEEEQNGIFGTAMAGDAATAADPLWEHLCGLAAESPRAATYEAWNEVEKAARDTIARLSADRTPGLDAAPVRLGDTLFLANILDSRLFNLFNQLRRLRNYVLESRNPIVGSSEVLNYLRLATTLKQEIERRSIATAGGRADPQQRP